MTGADEALSRYISDSESGRAGPVSSYMESVDENSRQELATGIDRYLMSAPRRQWDAAAYEASHAGRIADRLWRSMDGASGEWPILLPGLRERNRMTRSTVTGRLAEWLGARTDDPRVATYYHEMEQGLLPWRGVSNRVLEGLGSIFEVSVEELKMAARRGGDLPPPATAEAAMARVGAPDPRYANELDSTTAEETAGMASPAAEKPQSEWDDIDLAFLGGDR